jgi:hypothetical protein
MQANGDRDGWVLVIPITWHLEKPDEDPEPIHLVGIHTPLADKVGLHKVAPGDSAGLLALISRITKKVERTMSGQATVLSCYEAGYDGFWLHRVLVEAGIINHVIDPASLQVKRVHGVLVLL